jgi:hydroxypyruvate reductase
VVDLNLHRCARVIFDHALASVDPRPAVKVAMTLDVLSRPVYSIAIGKAATSMALGLEDALGERLRAGVISAPVPFDSKRWQSFIGGHPLPNEVSLRAAQAAYALLDRANAEQAAVVFLISGGGSAMLEWPANDEISLTDLRLANQALVTCGARITEVNAVRRA